MPQTIGLDASNVLTYNWIRYENYMRNVDLYFHSGSGGIKMSLVCKPGFLPEDLMLLFNGQDSLKVDVSGALKMWKRGKFIRLEQAVAFQVDPFNTIQELGWNAHYQPQGGTGVVTFEFSNYDPSRDLILQIGPTPVTSSSTIEDGLCWSTYLGGDADDYSYSSGVDEGGYYYVTGRTRSVYETFPNVDGVSLQNGPDLVPMFVTAFTNNHRIRWTAYLSGASGEQYPYAIALLNDGVDDTQMFIGGAIYGNSLWTQTLTGAYNDNTAPSTGFSGFLARFDFGGNLEWSTYFGNTNTEIRGLAFDAQDRLIISGSDRQGGVPAPASQPTNSLAQPHNTTTAYDGFVVGMDEFLQPRWTTYIGGAGTDYLFDMSYHNGRILVVGQTDSPDLLPLQGGGTNAHAQSTLAGGLDLFFTELNDDGVLQWSTYYGTVSSESIEGLQSLEFDPAGNAYIVYKIGGPTLDVVPGAGWYQTEPTDQVIMEIGSDRSISWASYFGLNNLLVRTYAVATDEIGNIFIAGNAYELFGDLPFSSTVELDGFYFQSDLTTGLGPNAITAKDGFIISWTPDHWLSLRTYLGGEDGADPDFNIIDHSEVITTLTASTDYLYVAGQTSKIGVPITSAFPRYDPGNFAWYQEDFNYNEPNGIDAFVSALCKSAVTSINDPHSTASPEAGLIRTGIDSWQINNAEDGHYMLWLHDVAGRNVMRTKSIVTGGLSNTFHTGNLAEATYVIRLTDSYGKVHNAGLKLVVTR